MSDPKGRVVIQVSIPTVEGFVGRECHGNSCGRYFRVLGRIPDLICPYCGLRQSFDATHTDAQRRLVRKAAMQQALRLAREELGLLAARNSTPGVRLRHAPPYEPAPRKEAPYVEGTVDSELKCPECSSRFQVKGIFGYCPACRAETLRIYDANLAVICHELKQAADPGRALRASYSDLVSTFESFCKRRAVPFCGAHGSFQDPYEASRFFREHCGVDILAGLKAEELLALRRVCQKRQACLHNEGILDERYVRKIPEDRELLGRPASLTIDELVDAAGAMRKVLDSIPEVQSGSFGP